MALRLVAVAVLCAVCSARRVPVLGELSDGCAVHYTQHAALSADCRRRRHAAATPLKQTYAITTRTSHSLEVTQMNASWNVPSLPEVDVGQTVYFWPGLKSEEPKMDWPVLQPVLQYGQNKAAWEIQSYFVDGFNGTALYGDAVDVLPGDVVDSYMLFDTVRRVWVCSCTNRRTQQSSVLRLSPAQCGNVTYHYAMLVLETVVSAAHYCSQYPKSPTVSFWGNKVNNVPAKWAALGASQHECGQSVRLGSHPGEVTFGWHN